MSKYLTAFGILVVDSGGCPVHDTAAQVCPARGGRDEHSPVVDTWWGIDESNPARSYLLFLPVPGSNPAGDTFILQIVFYFFHISEMLSVGK